MKTLYFILFYCMSANELMLYLLTIHVHVCFSLALVGALRVLLRLELN